MSDDIDFDKLSEREILILLVRTVPGRLNDHGRRIRSLETWRNLLAGGGIVAGAVLAALKLKLSISQGGGH